MGIELGSGSVRIHDPEIQSQVFDILGIGRDQAQRRFTDLLYMLDQPRIVDLAPTVLHVMGCPVPDDMDGRVLTEALAGRPELSLSILEKHGARDVHVHDLPVS